MERRLFSFGTNVGWKEASFSFNRQKTTLKEKTLEDACLLNTQGFILSDLFFSLDFLISICCLQLLTSMHL